MNDANPPIPTPPIDLNTLLGRCMGNCELAMTLLSKFETQLRDELGRIQQAFQTNDSQLAVRVSHTLSGAAATLSATDIQLAARKIESAAKDQQLASAAEPLAQLEAHVHRCLDYLPAARASMKPPPIAASAARSTP